MAILGLLWLPACQPASGVDRAGAEGNTGCRTGRERSVRSRPVEMLRLDGSSPAAARALYLVLKRVGVRPLQLVNLERRLRWPRNELCFTDLAAAAKHHGAKLQPYPGSFEAWLARKPAGLVFLRGEGRRDVVAPWVVSNPSSRPASARGLVRLVDPVRGARDWTPEALEAAWCAAAVVTRVDDPGAPGPGNDAPDLVCEEIAWHFGEVTKGARIAHVFRLKNAGNRPLRIGAIKTTCGCAGGLIRNEGSGERLPAVAYPDHLDHLDHPDGSQRLDEPRRIVRGADVGKEAIAPGDTVELLLVFDTNHRGNDQRVTAEILSNDPDEPVVQLHLEGKVVRRYVLEPDLLFFRETDADESPVMYCRVQSVSGKPFCLTDLRTTSPFLTVEEENRARHANGPGTGRAEHRLRVCLKPGRPPGAFAAHVCFRAGGHPMAVTVAARVTGVVRVEPRCLTLGRVRRGEPAEARAVVRGEGAAFEVLGVAVDRDDMTVVSEPSGPGAYRLTLRLKPGWQAPDLRATVTVRTSDVRQPRLAVPVEGFVSRR